MKITSEKRDYYQNHLAACKASGLTQKDYCKQENLAYGTFKSWRSKLEKACTQPPRFIEASPVEPEKSSSNALVLQISLTNGARIGVCAQASDKMIGHVLALAGKAL